MSFRSSNAAEGRCLQSSGFRARCGCVSSSEEGWVLRTPITSLASLPFTLHLFDSLFLPRSLLKFSILIDISVPYLRIVVTWSLFVEFLQQVLINMFLIWIIDFVCPVQRLIASVSYLIRLYVFIFFLIPYLERLMAPPSKPNKTPKKEEKKVYSFSLDWD